MHSNPVVGVFKKNELVLLVRAPSEIDRFSIIFWDSGVFEMAWTLINGCF